jgi:hypothetical protein
MITDSPGGVQGSLQVLFLQAGKLLFKVDTFGGNLNRLLAPGGSSGYRCGKVGQFDDTLASIADGYRMLDGIFKFTHIPRPTPAAQCRQSLYVKVAQRLPHLEGELA